MVIVYNGDHLFQCGFEKKYQYLNCLSLITAVQSQKAVSAYFTSKQIQLLALQTGTQLIVYTP